MILRQFWTKTACLLALLVAVAGCGEDPAATTAQDSQALADAADDGTAPATDAAAGSDGGADSVLPDLPLGEDASQTAADADATDTYTGPSFACEFPGAAGCACSVNSDCAGGFCIDTPGDGRICTAACTSSCPDGYTCGLAPGADLVFVCLPRWPVYCNPCDTDDDCSTAGVGKSNCVDRGNLGKFCGAACTADGDCPAGSTCQQTTSAGGKSALQCMPAPGIGGVAAECTCSPAARLAQLGTTCFANNGGGGACQGVRQCSDDGLTSCSALVKPETCNGADDDCDGETDEASCDDKNACTMDTCGAGGCSHTPTAGSCDADGNPCTVNDACDAGTCKPGAPKLCDDGNSCTLDVCSPAQGCVYTPDNGVGCSDGDPCTVGDLCQNGQCQPGAPKLCGAGDACNTPSCNATSGQCEPKPKAAGTLCDDGSACTTGDACKDGSCAGNVLTCNDNNPCTTETCAADKGCQFTKVDVPCNDGNACTQDDQCYDGKCFGTSQAGQCDDGNPCTNDSCEPIAGCKHGNNSAKCDDGDACTANDQCSQGACKGGSSTCQCQSDADCPDDGNLCNGTRFCDKSTATFACKTKPGTEVTCDTSNVCAPFMCVPASGACVQVAKNGIACSDGSVCTLSDECDAGTCVGSGTFDCTDGNDCTLDSCDNVTGCQHANTAGPCSDGNACTSGEVCEAGACKTGTAKVCNDDNPCTTDSCNPSTGSCVFSALSLDGSDCDDGNACTAGDKCAVGECKSGAALDCEDGNPCVVNECDPAVGCKNTQLADGTPCGGEKKCLQLQCVENVCGNSILDAGEECDTGSDTSSTNGTGCVGCKAVGVEPETGDLIISEVMYAPGTPSSHEWFELYNFSDKYLDLNGLSYGDVETYDFFEGAPVVPPKSYYLVAAETLNSNGTGVATTQWWTGTGVVPDYTYYYCSTQLQSTPMCGGSFGILFGNGGDSLSICKNLNSSGNCLACSDVNSNSKCDPGEPAAFSIKHTLPNQSLNGPSRQLGSQYFTPEGSLVTSNWCAGTSTFVQNGGNSTNRGTPGAANSKCN